MSMSSNQPYLFRAIYDWIIDNDMTPYVLVDAGAPLVKVPQQSINEGKIILNISPRAVMAYHVDNDALSFSARFSGVEQSIYIPMAAILALYTAENGEGMAFSQENTINDNANQEAAVDETLNTELDSEPETAKKKDKPFLKIIK